MTGRDKSETVQLKLRIKEPLRQQIEVSARERGVSMNAEIADRLEKSFQISDRMEEIFGSRAVFEFVKVIASVINQVGRSEYWRSNGVIDNGSRWLSHLYAYDEATRAASRVLETLRPTGDISVPRGVQMPDGPHPSPKGIGEGTASVILQELAESGGDETKANPNIGERIRRKLGIPEADADPPHKQRTRK